MHFPLWRASIRSPIHSTQCQRRRHHCSSRYRPHIEVLEGRWVPSTFLVTTTDNAGPGSFRQAILDANATPGTNEIDFAIGDGGPQTIRPTSPLPVVTHTLTIDGTTQPGFAGSPLIELNGTDAGVGTNGLVISAQNSVIQGLVINAFRGDGADLVAAAVVLAGSNNVVRGNFLGTDLTGTQAVGNDVGVLISRGEFNHVGGTTAGERNLISGNSVAGVEIRGTPGGADAIGNGVRGNYIGTDVTGTLALGNGTGVYFARGSNNSIGGPAGFGNLISGNLLEGVKIESGAGTIQGNFIGTDVTGTQALGNRIGVMLSGERARNNHIGGTTAGLGNLISGNGEDGLLIDSVVTGGTVVQGNLIGTDVNGTAALGNGGNGVVIRGGAGNAIGGRAAGAGNTIAFNGGDGVLVDGSIRNAILGNAIFANGNLGIELVNGGNNDQVAPLLTSATTDGSSTTVTGTLSSTPNSTFTLELFANSVNDPSGSGEQFLGSVQVTTDADGNASFTATFAVAIEPGWFLTATATDPAFNTSAFSAGVEVTT
jgi:hypothetical protein